MSPPAPYKPCLSLFAVLLSVFLAACSINPPVQEMSNARQTIQSAYDVKAQVYAPTQLKEAERLMKQATTALDAGDYSSAREYAIAAQQLAVKARQAALNRKP